MRSDTAPLPGIARARALRVPFLWVIGPWMRRAGLGDHLVRHDLTDAGEGPALVGEAAGEAAAEPLYQDALRDLGRFLAEPPTREQYELLLEA